MEFHLLPILTFISLAMVASHAAVLPEAYWKSVLPNTPIPKAVRDLLYTEGSDTNMNVGDIGKHVVSKARTQVDLRNYGFGANEEQLDYNPDANIFFLEKDIHEGSKMNLNFFRSTSGVTFLPRKVAESIPFSSKKLPEIFNKLSVKPNSMQAEMMKETIKECETSVIKGEEKYCATSLESMIDFTTSKLGKKSQAISTEVEKESEVQRYSIVGVKQMGRGGKTVVCHKQDYVYAVFYCHKTQTAVKPYVVSLVGVDGTKVKGVAVCHMDTSAWNPKNLAFLMLKVKPGTVPICHFLPEDHVVWVPY